MPTKKKKKKKKKAAEQQKQQHNQSRTVGAWFQAVGNLHKIQDGCVSFIARTALFARRWERGCIAIVTARAVAARSPRAWQARAVDVAVFPRQTFVRRRVRVVRSRDASWAQPCGRDWNHAPHRTRRLHLPRVGCTRKQHWRWGHELKI